MATRKGTQIAADAARELRWAAEDYGDTEYGPRLSALARELDRLAGHRYVRTHKGAKGSGPAGRRACDPEGVSGCVPRGGVCPELLRGLLLAARVGERAREDG